MMRIAIIGGGISGLAAAFELEEQRRAGAEVEYVLYESSSRLGGVLRTELVDGCLVEAGPDSFVTEKPWAADLCRDLGIGDQLIGSNDAGRKTYILTRGRLVEMPDGLMFMVPTKILPTGLSSLFSWKTKLRMTQELFHPPRAVDHDESVAAFVERHYGSEMVDRLADPLLSGVYGGEADNLSVRAVLPRFAEMERTHGSLGRAMLAARKKIAAAPRKAAPPLFTSLKRGMQHLAETVVSRLTPSALLTNALVQAIQPQPEAGGWLVSAGLQSDQFDGVIVALPGMAASNVLRIASPELSKELAAIQYSSSITVGLGYDHEVRRSLPPGFGFLVPRSEGQKAARSHFRAQQISPSRARRSCSAALLFRGSECRGMFGRSATSNSSPLCATNCSKLSDCAPSLYLPESTSGSLRWRNTAWDIWNASNASRLCENSCPASHLPATATGALVCPIVCAPAATPPSNLCT